MTRTATVAPMGWGPNVFADIDSRSPTPLYEQIAARVRAAVASRELSPGDPLPSVRALAGNLRVNPSTVVQAYRDLATDGFVETRHGQGTFIRELPTERRTEERMAQARRLVRGAIQEAARIGLGVEDLLRALNEETGAEAS